MWQTACLLFFFTMAETRSRWKGGGEKKTSGETDYSHAGNLTVLLNGVLTLMICYTVI